MHQHLFKRHPILQRPRQTSPARFYCMIMEQISKLADTLILPDQPAINRQRLIRNQHIYVERTWDINLRFSTQRNTIAETKSIQSISF